MKPRCNICEEDFSTSADYEAHMQQHRVTELMPENDSDFIPEAPETEMDPVSGLPKKARKIFRQEPHSPLTEYGG